MVPVCVRVGVFVSDCVPEPVREGVCVCVGVGVGDADNVVVAVAEAAALGVAGGETEGGAEADCVAAAVVVG
jgi:hypothetical protein